MLKIEAWFEWGKHIQHGFVKCKLMDCVMQEVAFPTLLFELIGLDWISSLLCVKNNVTTI